MNFSPEDSIEETLLSQAHNPSIEEELLKQAEQSIDAMSDGKQKRAAQEELGQRIIGSRKTISVFFRECQRYDD